MAAMSQTTTASADVNARATFVGTEGVYLLPHHAKEIERLQRQHHFMYTSTGGDLLRVPLPGDDHKARILDCGCADGTWLRDFAANNRSRDLALYGVDIGSSLFPSADSQSREGIDLRQHDITTPFPESWNWKNSFDAIHQRLLVWGLKANQWPAMSNNCRQILKPGGWLQLVEAEWIDNKVPTELPEQAKLAQMQRWSTALFDMDVDIAYKLEDMLSKQGFVNVQKFQYNHGYGHLARVKEQGDPSAELYVECFRSLDEKMPADGIPGVAKTPSEFHAFLDRLEVEIKTKGYQPKLNFIVAQKPE